MYDFEKYYADMDVKAEVNVDLSGVQIENPQGNPNEHVTNNVAYYVTAIALANDAEYTDAVAVGINDRVEIIIEEGASHEEHFFARMHPLSDLLEAGVTSAWNPGKYRERYFDLDTSYDTTTITYRVLHDGTALPPADYTHARVFVAPRYEFIVNNGYDDPLQRIDTGTLDPLLVNQNVISDKSVSNLSATMRAVYMMLGINGTRRVSIKDFRHSIAKGGRFNAVIRRDIFDARMGQISAWCAENNYGVDVKFYDSSMSDPIPEGIDDASPEDYARSKKMADAKHARYLAAVIAADKTSTSIGPTASFDDVYGTHLSAFLGNPRISPLIDDMTPTGVGVTALIPPMKDAVKGMFFNRTDIERTFYAQFEQVYSEIGDALGIMSKYLSRGTKRKMEQIGSEFTRMADDDGSLAFDLDSILDMLHKNYDSLGEGNSIYAIGSDYDLNFVTVYPRVFQVNGKFEPEAGTVASWGVTPNPADTWSKTADDGTIVGATGMHWVTADSGDYATDNYAWNKYTIDMTSDEVREILVAAFNWILYVDNQPTLEYHVDFDITDTTFSGGYDSSTDADVRIQQCKRFVELVGGWMNLFRTCVNKEGFWKFVQEHPFTEKEGLMHWLIRLGDSGVISWDLTGSYKVMAWASSSTTGGGLASALVEEKQVIKYSGYAPSYLPYWGIDPYGEQDMDNAVRAAQVMISAYKDMKSQLVKRAFRMNPITVARAWLSLEDAEQAITDLSYTVDNIIWYQAFVNESVFTNKSVLLDLDNWIKTPQGDAEGDDYIQMPFNPWTLPARFMVPVSMYRKVRQRYRWYGIPRYRTVNVFDGVRWAEVRFYDLNVFNEYPQVAETPGTVVSLNIPCTISREGGTCRFDFETAVPEEAWNTPGGELLFNDVLGTTAQVVFDGDMSAHLADGAEAPALIGDHVAVSVKVPPERSRNDSENKSPVTVHVKAPGLPYDNEIRKQAFVEYGPLSQDRLFEVVRYGDGGFPGIAEDLRFDGWKVFRQTSRKIEDMREGFGLYDKVAFLMSVLTHEFGSNRVELINTWRSADDQKGICTGGPESGMLSWHNYGMAAKILIYKADGTTPIEDKSDDMKRLVKVARAFTEICADGRVGNPCNVVWCGRLTVNPSLFDWEFLPVGVGHKDAFRFREAIMAQKDPIKECAYVDVDAAGLVKSAALTDGRPYILRTSSAYRNARVINGHHYVSPDRIVNYSTPEDIVLYDLVEYIDLINLKLNANGNKLGDRGNMYEWKTLNDSACSQLIRYFALTNNIKSAKALIAGDFVEKYQAIEDAYYSKSPIDYVKHMLGDHYADARVTIDSMNDSGYISLASGRMYIKVVDQVPDNVPTMIDMHGQQRVDSEHVKRGVWRNGVFYGVDEIDIPYVESDGPVIDGYVGDQASYGEAMFLHQAVASEIHAAFIKIREMFERYNGVVMYDRFRDGPNADKFDQLENEFGAIAAQDLMDFDDLESMLAQDNINRLADIDSNGDRNGVGDGDIYEKVVNNAQLAGMRKAVRTSERMHVTDRGNGLTPGEIYRAVMEGRAPGANDIMAKR